MLPYSATIMVCFVLGLMTGSSFGKTVKITLTSDPQQVQTLITKELILKCEISLLTRRSSQVTDVSYINVIEIIDQNGDMVASKTNGTAGYKIKEKGFKDKGAQATYSVGDATGYLNLRVPNPDKSTTCDSTTCTFTCKATVYRTIEGTPTIIQDDTTVTWAETPINELVEYVYNIEHEKLVNMNNDIVNNSKEIVNNNKEIVNNNKEMVKKTEITQGYRGCTPQQVEEPRYVNVNFGRTYAKPPRVFLSHRYTVGTRSGGGWLHNNNFILADQITTTGFRLGCYTWNKMYYLEVKWIAFPSA